MTVQKSQNTRTPILLGVSLIVVSLIANGYLLFTVLLDRISISFADSQTQMFDDLVEQARVTPTLASGHIDYVQNHYPSGTRLRAGSALDKIVERAREGALLDLRAILTRPTDHVAD